MVKIYKVNKSYFKICKVGNIDANNLQYIFQ